ncbi:ATP-grasp domain-containing protein [Williamwhitmania taraxaci]|uniref:ATP-grasp domain-containing protein n=2 Tax=Williamwhitmania taraxaci TaxID=1640674 RepID=A0A1G6J437_9BACT|nr:ATP-grasp domain-containing protein [Williamwhitmania taraxaci]
MILLDKPFVSEFLQLTLAKNQYPVVKTANSELLITNKQVKFISETEAIKLVQENGDELVYSNSENAISWVEKNLPFSRLPKTIKLFKDKVAFRELVKPIFPNFYFKSVPITELATLSSVDIPKPFIIKPAIGFFSMGVHKVDTDKEWEALRTTIVDEIEQVKDLYPKEVMNATNFIIEDCIEGDEYAVDCYFNSTGKATVLNIMEHIFGSGKDVSDRVYLTSKDIIEKNLANVEAFLSEVSRLAELRNFPAHIEIRIDKTGTIYPIEVNPMRFGGWCSTGDMAWLAYGINEYECLFEQTAPNWSEILKDKAGKVYSISILDNNSGYKAEDIVKFDYDKLLSHFEKPLELRKINFHEYPVFAFLFSETRQENMAELERILKSNLREYIVVKPI